MDHVAGAASPAGDPVVHLIALDDTHQVYYQDANGTTVRDVDTHIYDSHIYEVRRL